MSKLITVFMFICLTVTSVSAETVYNDLRNRALNAGVSQETADMLAERTAKSGFSESDINLIKSVISSLYQTGAQSAAEKVLEGIAKNAAPARIAAALKNVQSRYDSAMRIADKTGVTHEYKEIVANITAEAMAAGAKAEQLAELADEIGRKTSEKDEFAEAVYGLYRDMVRFGIDNKQTFNTAKKMLGSMTSGEIRAANRDFGQSSTHSDAADMAEKMQNMAEHGNMRDESGNSGEMGGSGGSSGGSGGHGGGKR